MYNSVIIMGPTASGKTSLSVKLAKLLNFEIISADSMQIYKTLDIGTAKVTKKEQCGVKHHLIDIVEPTDCFTVSDYKSRALKIINDLLSKNSTPIIVGGTGFYIESLINNFEYGLSDKNQALREDYVNLAKEFGNEYVFNILESLDPETSKTLHPNDLKRVIRAIEIFKTSSIKKSDILSAMQNTSQTVINPLIIVINWNRDVLYKRIDKRVDLMIQNGLIDEVKTLIKQGLTLDNQCMQGIGYKEIYAFLTDELTYVEAIEKIKQASRNYAKRQLTWFNHIPNTNWFNLSEVNEEEIINFIIEKLNEK